LKKVIIFGISGTIGQALGRLLVDKNYDVYGTYNQNKPLLLNANKVTQLGIEQLDDLDHFLEKVKPDFVIMALRGDFKKQLLFHQRTAEYLQLKGGRMVFCSTANVFDGAIDSPHYEEDEPKAVSDYGQYKIECERVMADYLHDSLAVVRIPTILGKHSPRINELRQKLEERIPIAIYTNLYSTRNSDVMLAKQIEYILNHWLPGISHLATSDIMNHSEFTKELVQRWGYSNVHFEEKEQDDFSGGVPSRYYNSLLSRKSLPNHLQLNHQQLIDDLENK
jgi:dTDP-4-dehydrorhamnose reductase